MATPRIYADPLKTDDDGRLLLVTRGTRNDLQKYGIVLSDGLEVDFYTDDADDAGVRDDLLFSGVVHFDGELCAWVADIDWSRCRHASDVEVKD
ncbi:hypothetical protein Rhe02_34580 [Rhizocola hellebori]|uniref:Uncharacterized protein n=1 Tax=Rhizocola hellebori TaxID=1392758 RepID=A0A8J3Q908_9ACTN|nr:hypothetical protein [Rhizocola hellebori]GIH05391.1 hypothetical protein Rhe02_34580 [Rhizocola hellebori]